MFLLKKKDETSYLDFVLVLISFANSTLLDDLALLENPAVLIQGHLYTTSSFVCSQHQNSNNTVYSVLNLQDFSKWHFCAQCSSPNVDELFSGPHRAEHTAAFLCSSWALLVLYKALKLPIHSSSVSLRSSNTRWNRTRRSPPGESEARRRRSKKSKQREAQTRGTILPVNFSNVVVCEEPRNTM